MTFIVLKIDFPPVFHLGIKLFFFFFTTHTKKKKEKRNSTQILYRVKYW